MLFRSVMALGKHNIISYQKKDGSLGVINEVTPYEFKILEKKENTVSESPHKNEITQRIAEELDQIPF